MPEREDILIVQDLERPPPPLEMLGPVLGLLQRQVRQLACADDRVLTDGVLRHALFECENHVRDLIWTLSRYYTLGGLAS